MCGISYLLPSEDMQQSFRTYFKDGIVSLLVSTNLHPCNSEFEVLISHVIIVLDTIEMQ